jgi:cytochrome c-type biogenesis protein CcmH/NrfG
MLAEYWLRREQNLNKALESFKGAMRQESDNPRWLLRIAQVYMVKGWRKEATSQVEQLMRTANLPEFMKKEVNLLADQLKNG